MVPSRRGAKVLKATDLAKVGDVGDEEEEPQCKGRGQSGESDDLKRSNDGKGTRRYRGRWKSTSSVCFTDGQSGGFLSIHQSLYT